MKRILLLTLCIAWIAQGVAQETCGMALEITTLDDGSGNCVPLVGEDNTPAVPWEVSPGGPNFVGNCWGGADTLNVMYYFFVAQGVSAFFEVTNGPGNYFISILDASGCATTTPNELWCGTNGAPVDLDNELTIGSTYYIIVAFEGNATGSFDLCAFNPVPAANDECIDAIDLTSMDGVPCNSGQDNYYPSSELQFPACFGTATQSVWFSFTAQGVSIADLHIEGAPDVANVAVWDFEGITTCDLTALSLLACQTDVDVNNPIVLDNLLLIGNEYYIEVTFDNNATGTFSVCLDAPEPAFNDDCFDAVEFPMLELANENTCITDIGGENLNNDWPSTDFAMPCWDPAFTYSVWFWFEAQGPDVNIDVIASFGDAEQIAILDFPAAGVCMPGAVVIECSVGAQLEVDDQLEIGNIYYVTVAFDNDGVGDYCINIFNPTPPDNDTACAAVPLVTDACNANSGPPCVNDCFTTEYANSDDSPGTGGVIPDCIPYITNTVWFTIELADPNNVGFEITLSEGTAQDLGLIIGTFNDCTGAFDPAAFFCGAGTDPIEFGPVDDTETYYLIVGTTEADEGTFTICIDEIPPCFDNNYCEDPLGISSANDLGVLVTVDPDGTGACAGAGDPFTCVTGCNLFADVIEESVTCLGTDNDPVVWYTFSTDGNAALANVVLTSDEFDAPAFQIFLTTDGTCGGLTPLGGCTDGSGGEASITGLGIGAGQVYFIAVGGILTEGGEFELCISILEDANACTIDAGVTITGSTFGNAPDGPFFPGETVSICMAVNDYRVDAVGVGNNCQWLQGVVPTFGNGWDPSSFDLNGMPLNTTLNGSTMPAPGIAGGATWDWFSDVTYHHDNCFYNVGDFDGNGTLDICNTLYDDECVGPGLTGGSAGPCWQAVPGNVLPPGWFAFGIQGDCGILGHPTVDYGDGTCCGCNLGSWQFCFELTVRPFPDCDVDQTTNDLSLGFVTFADGEVGSWTGGASICANDEPVDIRLPGCCVELDFANDTHDPLCSDGLFSWIIDFPTNPNVDFWRWTVDAGGVTGASGGDGPTGTLILDNLSNTSGSVQIVTYTILGFDGGECPAVIWDVTVEVYPEITIDLDPFMACATPTSPYTLTPIVSGGDPSSYMFEWLDGSAGPSLTIAMPVAGQVYSVTVTDDVGCSAESMVTLDVYETFPIDINSALREICLEDGPIDLDGSASGGIPGYTFEWTSPMGNNQSGMVIQADETGQWNLLVTDNDGCTAEDSLSLEFYESPEIDVDAVSICLDNPVPEQIIAIVTNGTAPYEYFWQTPSTNITTSFIIVDEIGNYSITVTDRNGCSVELAFVVDERESPVINITPDLTVCREDLQMGIGLNVAPDVSFINYAWSTSGTEDNVIVAEEGVYTVSVTNDGGCVSAESVTVSIFDTIPDLFVDTVWICPGGTAILEGGFSYTYEWNFTNNNDFYLATREEMIFVTVTDINGCTRSEEIEVVQSSNLPVVFTADTVICSGVPIDINATMYQIITWYSDSELTNVIGNNTPTIMASTAGWYYIQVSDGDGCFGVDSIQIYESTPIPNVIGVPAICDGESSTLDVGTWAGIEWSTGEVTSTITTDTAGIFYVTVTDELNCSAVSMPFVVTESGIPDPQISGATSFCPSDSSALDAGGPFATYLWSNGQVGQSIYAGATGMYRVTVTNALGCEGIDSFLVQELTPLAPQIVGDDIICNSAAVTIDATAPEYVNYLWSTGEVSSSIQPDIAGTFIVTVTDANGCTGSDQIVIQAGDPMPAIMGVDETCAGGVETLSLNVGYASYMWSTSEVSATIDVNSTGSYAVTVTDQLGCTGEANFDFTLNPNPSPIINGSRTYCVGGFTNLDVGAGYASYIWSDSQVGQMISVSSQGAIGVTVTDVNGCTGATSINIIESTELDLNVRDTSLCQGDVIELIIGNYDTYTWFDNSTDPTYQASAGGNYAVTVTDVSGCTGTADIAVTEFIEPFATFTNAPNACNTSVGGVISTVNFSSLITSGDAGGTWRDVDNSGATGVFSNLDFTGVIPGDYQFEYTTNSAQGPCMDQSYLISVTIIDCVCPSPGIEAPADLCSDNAVLDLITLFNDSTRAGGVWSIVSVPAGNNPAQIVGSSFDGTNADPGLYDIQYTISGIPTNCTDNDIQQILVNDPPDAGLPGQPAQVCVAEDTTILLRNLITGAQAGGMWVETSVAMSQSGFNDALGEFDTELEMPGNYTFEYILQGTTPCPNVSTTIEVVIEDVPLADAGSDREITCAEPSADLDGSGSSQGNNFVYNWRLNGVIVATGDMNMNVTAPGMYELEVVNTATGCKSFDDVTVNVNGDIPVMITDLFLPKCLGDPPATVSVNNISGGTPPYTYTLNGAESSTTGTYSELPPGDYTVTVNDVNGCSDMFEFTVNATTSVDGAVVGELVIDRGDDFVLSYDLLEGVADSVVWTDIDGNPLCLQCDTLTIEATSNMELFVTIYDENGCSVTLPASLFVRVVREVYVPNVFSPNDDGMNDYVTLFAPEGTIIRKFEVFSRWGELVFSSAIDIPVNDPELGWDGRFAGQMLQPGVFVFHAQVLYPGDQIEEVIKGDITLIR